MIKRFLPIILLTFVNVIGFSILIPVLPEVARIYAPSLSQPVYGALLSAYSLFQFLGAPILGSLSDKYGRKQLLLVSQLGTTLSWVVFAVAYFAPSIIIGPFALPLFIIAFSRVIDGITGGNISVAQAWISDVTTLEEKTKAFGLIGAVFGFGFLIGPALGGFSSATPIGYLGTCIIAFLISVVTLVMMYLYLPESLPPEKRDHELELNFWQEINFLNKLKVFQHNPFLMFLLRIRLAFMLVFAAFVVLIILYLEQSFNLSQTGLGLTISVIGLFSIFNQAFLAGKLSDKMGNVKLFYLSLVIFTAALLTIPLLPLGVSVGVVSLSYIIMLVNSYFINAGISLGMPSFKSILVHNVSDKKQGLATGIDESLIAFGNSITPVVAGALYAMIGVYTFWVFALILVLPFVYQLVTTGRLIEKNHT